jgi:hypothetical protein
VESVTDPHQAPSTNASFPEPSEAERVAAERKLLRRLQIMMNMTMQVIAQDSSLSVEEASQMIADSREAALHMFPGKELAYDLIWRPRFQRLMVERFRLQ